MGRHETFGTALPLVEELLSGVAIDKVPLTSREAILAHRAARQALNDVCDAVDEMAIEQAGGDTSDEAMAPARAEWERRNDAELEAWNGLLSARPVDHAELIEQIRYIATSPALGDFQHPEVVLENVARSVEALVDPFDGRSPPAGFTPYPFEAPMGWASVPCVLQNEGARLLQIATGEMKRRLAHYEAGGFSADEIRGHETRIRRVLRIDAPLEVSDYRGRPRAQLPAPGSKEALAAFYAACGETDRLSHDAVHGYPELAQPGGMTFWSKDSLARALDRGEVRPAEYARLYPLAAEREHRIEAAAIATNIGALFALAHTDNYPQPEALDDVDDADPIDAAIARHRRAYAEWLPHLDATSEARGGSPELRAAEVAAEPFQAAEIAAFEALLDERPNSLRGLVALADYLPGAVRRDGRIDEGDLGLQALDAICNGLSSLAKVGSLALDIHASEPSSHPSPDLSAVPLTRLGPLQETFRSLWLHASGELSAPWCWDEKGEDYNDAGKVLETESDRLAELVQAVANEAHSRVPADASERDDRLEILLRHELFCEGKICDRSLMAEVVEAWGGRGG